MHLPSCHIRGQNQNVDLEFSINILNRRLWHSRNDWLIAVFAEFHSECAWVKIIQNQPITPIWADQFCSAKLTSVVDPLIWQWRTHEKCWELRAPNGSVGFTTNHAWLYLRLCYPTLLNIPPVSESHAGEKLHQDCFLNDRSWCGKRNRNPTPILPWFGIDHPKWWEPPASGLPRQIIKYVQSISL